MKDRSGPTRPMTSALFSAKSRKSVVPPPYFGIGNLRAEKARLTASYVYHTPSSRALSASRALAPARRWAGGDGDDPSWYLSHS